MSSEAAEARRLGQEGYDLGASGQSDEAIQTYDSVVARFADRPDVEVRAEVALALYNKAGRLYALGRLDEAVAVYDELIALLDDYGEPTLDERLARTLIQKGDTLREIGRPGPAIETFEEVAIRFAGRSDPALQLRVARALQWRALTLRDLDRQREAIETLTGEPIPRLREATTAELRDEYALALINRAGMLDELGDTDEAMHAYYELLARTRAGESEQIDEHRSAAVARRQQITRS